MMWLGQWGAVVWPAVAMRLTRSVSSQWRAAVGSDSGGVCVVGAGGGVGTDQVVEGESAGCGLLQQVVGRELAQVFVGGVEVQLGEGGGGVEVNVVTRVQGQQPEQTPPIGRQVLVGRAE